MTKEEYNDCKGILDEKGLLGLEIFYQLRQLDIFDLNKFMLPFGNIREEESKMRSKIWNWLSDRS